MAAPTATAPSGDDYTLLATLPSPDETDVDIFSPSP